MDFLHPWLVIAAIAFVSAGVGVLIWKRRWAPFLFMVAGAGLFLAGARPSFQGKQEAVTHALVVDVSASMRSRTDEVGEFLEKQLEAVNLPSHHVIKRFELSDAVREPGGPRGERADVNRLGDLTGNAGINGEVVFVTDGQIPLDDLYATIEPSRLLLLRLPPSPFPDAAVADLDAPGVAALGSTVLVRATIECDVDASVPWKILRGTEIVASGVKTLKAGMPAGVAHNYVVADSGLTRLRFVISLPEDREPANDSASVAIITGGKKVIDYCMPSDIPQQLDGLLSALRADETNDVRVRHTLPVSLSELEGVGVVIINNLPLFDSDASREQTQALATWVNSGGNLMMLGAHGAFGPGGYRNTPIEDVMPVRFRPGDNKPRRIVLLLDTSASMDDGLPGGASKLQRLKEAANRALDSFQVDDQVAVVGFRSSISSPVKFYQPGNPSLTAALGALRAEGSTHIATSLAQTVDVIAAGETKGARILLITDGEEGEGAEDALRESYERSATRLSNLDVRLDVVLTNPTKRKWADWMEPSPVVRLWQVGESGFEDLFETLDRALAGGDQEWIVTDKMEVGGVQKPLHLLVRTSLRKDPSVTPFLEAQTPVTREPVYPLLAQRQLTGRSVSLCTASWGNAAVVEFWQNEFFQDMLGQNLEFLLQNANRTNLVLNPLDDGGGELMWTSPLAPPRGPLQTNPGTAEEIESGRWHILELPEVEELRVTYDDRLLQRIPLPRLVSAELRATGDDLAFFSISEQAGARVVSSLNAWRPKGWETLEEKPVDLTWLPALLGVLAIVAGFAARRR